MNQQWKNEQEARKEILDAVTAYYYQFKKNADVFEPGSRIPYAGRVYDEQEIRSTRARAAL